jgi:hypothetical protein
MRIKSYTSILRIILVFVISNSCTPGRQHMNEISNCILFEAGDYYYMIYAGLKGDDGWGKGHVETQ